MWPVASNFYRLIACKYMCTTLHFSYFLCLEIPYQFLLQLCPHTDKGCGYRSVFICPEKIICPETYGQIIFFPSFCLFVRKFPGMQLYGQIYKEKAENYLSVKKLFVRKSPELISFFQELVHDLAKGSWRVLKCLTRGRGPGEGF